MPYFHLRLDYRSAEDLERYIDFVRRFPGKDKLIVLEKKGTNDKPHLHSIFLHDRSKSAVLNQFAKKFECYIGTKQSKANEYQLKPLTEAELYDAEKYLCKGEGAVMPPNIVLQTGKYSMEYTVSLHIAWWEMNAFLTKNKPKEQTGPMDNYIVTHRVEKVVKPKKNFYNDVIDYLHIQYSNREWTLRDTPLMFSAIMRLHGKHFRPYGPQQLENEMNVIMNILCHCDHYNDMYDKLKERGNIPNL